MSLFASNFKKDRHAVRAQYAAQEKLVQEQAAKVQKWEGAISEGVKNGTDTSDATEKYVAERVRLDAMRATLEIFAEAVREKEAALIEKQRLDWLEALRAPLAAVTATKSKLDRKIVTLGSELSGLLAEALAAGLDQNELVAAIHRRGGATERIIEPNYSAEVRATFDAKHRRLLETEGARTRPWRDVELVVRTLEPRVGPRNPDVTAILRADEEAAQMEQAELAAAATN